jgi:signal transduction histidine kinase
MKGTGLGLTSMQERLRLAGGELSVNSQPNVGTTIHACIPFNRGSDIGGVAEPERWASHKVHQEL